MGKNTEINLVGQPIFKQIINLLGAIDFDSIVKCHNADHYYKSFKAKTQLIIMLFGIISRCDSMCEICEGMRALSGKLNHLGLKSSPAKSTACDGLRNRSDKFMLNTLRKVCSINNENFYIDMEDVGNTVSSTIPIALARLKNQNKLLEGNKILLAGFGVGYSWGSCILNC